MTVFSEVSAKDVTRLVGDAPLCWIVPHADPSTAILMPVVAEGGDEGATASLLGHLPRRAPAATVLRSDPRASFLFLGANGYISPAMVGRDDWGPTWNFASARLEGEVVLGEGLTRHAVAAISRHMEGPGGWSLEALGPRTDELLARVIGFRAMIAKIEPRFKLGQDESGSDFASIRGHLGESELGRAMDRYRRG